MVRSPPAARAVVANGRHRPSPHQGTAVTLPDRINQFIARFAVRICRVPVPAQRFGALPLAGPLVVVVGFKRLPVLVGFVHRQGKTGAVHMVGAFLARHPERAKQTLLRWWPALEICTEQ